MEYEIIKLTKRYGQPSIEQVNDTTELYTWQLPQFQLVLSIIDDDNDNENENNINCCYKIELKENEFVHGITLDEFFTNIQSQENNWSTLLAKPYEIQLLERLTQIPSEHSRIHFGTWSITSSEFQLYNNPFNLGLQSDQQQQQQQFYLEFMNGNNSTTNLPIEQVIHQLAQLNLLKFDWSEEESNNNNNIHYQKVPNTDPLSILTSSFRQSNTTSIPVELLLSGLLVTEVTDSLDRWIRIVRDENYKIWKCFIGIPKHNQSILYEQSHLILQFTEDVEGLSLGKLTFSGFLPNDHIHEKYFTSHEEYEEYLRIEPQNIWWFGFDFNHTPIAHYQVFQVMKSQQMENVPTIDEYLLQCPDDFCDISPLEYTTCNWIKTSIEIDRVVPNRSYKTLDMCYKVLNRVNIVLLQNEEIFLREISLQEEEQEEQLL